MGWIGFEIKIGPQDQSVKMLSGKGERTVEETEQLEGTVEIVTFRNEQNGYTVLRLNEGGELVTVVGNFPTVHEGDILRVEGGWETHRMYGRQLHAVKCEQVRPATSEAILKYLSSGVIKGIGPSTACRMVEAFGEHTLEIMEKEPERLSQIKGISKAKAREIGERYEQLFGMREIMLRLSQYGISPEESLRIYQALGPASADQVEANPVVLCSSEIGFPFHRTDEIAAQIGLGKENEFRLDNGVLHVLRHNTGNGHTCLPRKKLVVTASALLAVEQDSVDIACDRLVEQEALISRVEGEEELLFLPYLYRAEHYIAGRLAMMMQFPPPLAVAPDSEIDRIEAEQGIVYEARQREAIHAALRKGVLILTGGPGTGKTTTLKAILGIMEKQGMKIALAAPTGRAAKRMSELTGAEAKTLHRLLEVEWSENNRANFARNERNPLDCDAVIIDELSMVDAPLFESLLRAMRLGCRLVMVGDDHQLPSVGAGNVLRDLLQSGRIPWVCLTEIFRQSMQSLIVLNAHRIVTGRHPELARRDGDFFLLEERNPLRASRLLTDLCALRLPKAYGFSPFDDIQVLCPSRKTALGTAAVNARLQEALNPPALDKAEITVGGILLREGDKVMQNKNNYELLWTRSEEEDGTGVFNGDIGILEEINRSKGYLSVRFDDRLALYTESDAADLELAYAVTVHKSQGSEYPCVIIPVLGAPPQLCYRNLLYTAVTRAKRLLVMVGSSSLVAAMVDNDKRTLRYTALRPFLEEAMPQKLTDAPTIWEEIGPGGQSAIDDQRPGLSG